MIDNVAKQPPPPQFLAACTVGSFFLLDMSITWSLLWLLPKRGDSDPNTVEEK